jgi:hypothetical protein
MKIFECKRGDIYDIGFVDPNRAREVVVQRNPKDIENVLLRALLRQQNRREILLPYNFQ